MATKKILIGFNRVTFSKIESFNAVSKARKDVEDTCRSMGFVISNIRLFHIANARIKHLLDLLSLVIKAIVIPIGSNLYIQYPISHPRVFIYFLHILKSKKCSLNYIVHDIETLRFHPNWQNIEVKVLNHAERLFIHTNAMKKHLGQLGVKAKMHVFNLFDYYTAAPMSILEEQCSKKKIVAFAGNLKKSKFLHKLQRASFLYGIRYSLYGLPPDFDCSSHPSVEYRGAFNPEDVGFISAGWGLVWDGDDIETCSGKTGQYLKYNSSHKTSLYLAAGIPLIVWRHSGLAEFVIQYNIGIVVSSLAEITDIIMNMSDDHYEEKVKSAREMSKLLRNGILLKQAITNNCLA